MNRAVLKLIVPVLLVLIGLAMTTHTSLALSGSAVSVDLFTQKAIYNGKGSNSPSDLFGPAETVILYAEVMIDNTPTSNMLVTYEITGPQHMTEDQKVYQTAETNASGIAETEFSLAVTNQSDAFGTWIVTARIEIGGEIYSDLLWFGVNRIIELGLIRTLDDNLFDRTSFGIGGYVGFEITLRNNAKTPKTTELAVTLLDELKVAVATMEIGNFTVPPIERTLHLFNKLYIPKFAFPGRATLIVNALDEHSVAYCPKSSTIFLITIYDLTSPNFTDASVYLNPLPAEAEAGIPLTIHWTVRNEGTITLNDFNTSIHVDNTILTSAHIGQLEPYTSQTLQATWNTNNLQERNHIVTASVQTFPNEADLSDNTYTSQVALKTTNLSLTHDLQVLNVACSTHEAAQGDTVTIDVTVKNKGNTTETSTVKTYYGSFLISEKNVTKLAAGSQQILSYQWNTANAPQGTYQISATVAPVEGETSTDDNTYYDGQVTIILHPPFTAHNIAITSLATDPTTAETNTPITIRAAVNNLGNESETFNVTFYANTSKISIKTVTQLQPSSNMTISFAWDTSNLQAGNYTIWALADYLPEETNTTDNMLTDGTVTLLEPSLPSFNWTTLIPVFAIAMLGIVILLIILYFLSRRRGKKSSKSSYIIISHAHI
ncbi:hypothetical protein MUP01_02070 [Candidatus Bathyarchaeota archaeon]|nr:hypothetical protein [Candidatus Bathyarchaeota archaeon]